MTVEQLMLLVGSLSLIIGYWLKDWKGKVESHFQQIHDDYEKKIEDLKTDYEYGLAVKQKELDLLFNDTTYLKVEMEKRVRREELDEFKKELKSDLKEIKDDLRRQFNDLFTMLQDKPK